MYKKNGREMIGRKSECVEKGEYPGKISLDIRMTIKLDGPKRMTMILQSWEIFAGGLKNLLDTFCNQERI